MASKPHSRPPIVFAGAAVLAAASLLFVNAMSIGDFALPGQGLLAGQSNVRLILAFVLLIGLALALLAVIYRTALSAERAHLPSEAGSQAQEDIKKTDEPDIAVLPVDAARNKEDSSNAIIAATAGELRTSVELMTEELEDILEDEAPADEHVQALCDETDRLKKIIAGMEQLSQAQASSRTLKKEPIQVEQLLNSIIDKTRMAVPDRDVTYNLECEPGFVIKGDPVSLGRIIGNILENAAQSIRGSGSVMLTAAPRDEVAVFTIKDTGTGIRRAHLSHIYEHFFRGTGCGIGLGLSIVKELVDACGGKIDVETVAGKGTTFIVQLPRE